MANLAKGALLFFPLGDWQLNRTNLAGFSWGERGTQKGSKGIIRR